MSELANKLFKGPHYGEADYGVWVSLKDGKSIIDEIDRLTAELVDLKERYECKTDALNASLMTIDAYEKEVERLKEENYTLKRVYNQLFDAASDMQTKLSRYEAALKYISKRMRYDCGDCGDNAIVAIEALKEDGDE